MSVNSVNYSTNVNTADYNKPIESTAAKTEPAEQTKAPSAAETGVVYEKSEGQEQKATYSVNKMSPEDRAALVEQLKAEQEARKSDLVNLVQNMLGQQAKSFGIANDDDSIWKFLAKGDFTVDAATKAQAQADIAEDGYWGVAQTSQRMFDFASALAGDDVDKMKEMQEAMMKGYEQAQKTWGRELPEISQQTIDAANKLFDEYYAARA